VFSNVLFLNRQEGIFTLCHSHSLPSVFPAVVASLYTTIITVSSLGLKKPWPGYRHPGFLEATHDGAPDQSLAFNVRPEKLLRTPQFYYLFAAATLLVTGPLRSLLKTAHIFTQTNVFFFHHFCGSMTFCCGSGSADPNPDPSIFIIDLQDANKKLKI
jgi:hypothetical protein